MRARDEATPMSGPDEVAPTWATRVAALLERVGTRSTWRDIAAFLCAFLTLLSLSGGLFLYGAWVQVGVVAAICAGTIASRVRTAVLAAGAAMALDALLGPAAVWDTITHPTPRWEAWASVAVAAVLAALVRYAIGRRWVAGRWLVWAGVAIIVVNMWATVLGIDGAPTYDPVRRGTIPSLFQHLGGDVPQDLRQTDEYFYLMVYERLRQGAPYYRTFVDERKVYSVDGQPPQEAINVRPPTLFWLWLAVPGGPTGLVYALLVLTSGAVVSVPIISARAVKMPFALTGCAAMASSLAAFSIQLSFLFAELWGVTIGVMGLAAYAMSLRDRRWRGWTAGAIALAVLAALVRENLVFLPVAGLVASFAIRDSDRRRFHLRAWAIGCALMGTAYAIHLFEANRVVSHSPYGRALLYGGIDFALAALRYYNVLFGGSAILSFGLAFLGAVGILSSPDRSLRIASAAVGLLPLLAFLVVGNGAFDSYTNTPLNYWGIAVVPFLYAAMPGAFAVLPGMAAFRVARPSPGARLTAPVTPGGVPPAKGRARTDATRR